MPESTLIVTRLGPYEITAKLGEGGMGEVCRAHDGASRLPVTGTSRLSTSVSPRRWIRRPLRLALDWRAEPERKLAGEAAR